MRTLPLLLLACILSSGCRKAEVPPAAKEPSVQTPAPPPPAEQKPAHAKPSQVPPRASEQRLNGAEGAVPKSPAALLGAQSPGCGGTAPTQPLFGPKVEEDPDSCGPK